MRDDLPNFDGEYETLGSPGGRLQTIFFSRSSGIMTSTERTNGQRSTLGRLNSNHIRHVPAKRNLVRVPWQNASVSALPPDGPFSHSAADFRFAQRLRASHPRSSHSLLGDAENDCGTPVRRLIGYPVGHHLGARSRSRTSAERVGIGLCGAPRAAASSTA